MRTLALLVLASLTACSGSNKSGSSGFLDNGTSSGSSSGGSSGGSSGDPGSLGSSGGTGSSSGGTNGCSEAAKLVYVVSEENDLYRFDPASLAFTKIGPLTCSALGANPNSMAVDRSGTAWVNYSNGMLFKVSTADASCQSTSFQPGQHGFQRFGMAFSSNSAGSNDETLFVCGIENDPFSGALRGKGLAKIDLSTFALTPIGDFSGPLRAQGAELTGTGDGKLYGFFTTNPAQLAEIDKTTGATPTPRALDNVQTGTDWAFSFWGGDFWFYTADTQNRPGDTTDVTRLKSATDNTLGVVKNQIGFRIVGAGVSTCAPTSPPK